MMAQFVFGGSPNGCHVIAPRIDPLYQPLDASAFACRIPSTVDKYNGNLGSVDLVYDLMDRFLALSELGLVFRPVHGG